MKRLFALLLLLPALAFGQFSVNTGGAKAPYQAPNVTMPPGKIYVNLATIPKRHPSQSTPRFSLVCTGDYATCQSTVGDLVPNRYTDSGFGAFNSGSQRIACAFSHAAFDDPIVYPGQAGLTHLHYFAGNASTRSASDLANMATSGNSTCQGGTLWRVGYWFPAPVYECETGEHATIGCTESRNGELQPMSQSLFYYKQSGFDSDHGSHADRPYASRTAMQWWPAGHRQIAGKASATTVQYKPGTTALISSFQCYNAANEFNSPIDHIPGTPAETTVNGSPCVKLIMSVLFPECWDGVNLDSPGAHNGHMKYMTNYSVGCDDPAFPIAVPNMEVNVLYNVNAADLKYWRLTSDQPRSSGIPAGITMHADRVEGVSDDIIPEFGMSLKNALLQECYREFYTPRPQHSDCHAGDVGSPKLDGKWYRLTPPN